MKQGVNVVGRLVGLSSEQWARDGKSGVNLTLGIARTFTDRYGAEDTETFGIDVRGDALQQKFREAAEKYKGKVVSVHVRVQAFAGRNGAFVRYSAVQDSEVVALITSAPVGANPAARAS